MFKIVSSPVVNAADVAAFARQLLTQVNAVLAAPCMTRASALVLCEYIDCVNGRVPGVSRASLKPAKAALVVYLTSCARTDDQQSLSASSPAAKAALAQRRATVLQFPVLREVAYG